MVKYGVVGTGYFGAELARYMQKNDGAEITLLYDPDNAEAIAEELGAKVASSLDELVSSDEVDCVIVQLQIIFIRNRLLRLHNMAKMFFVKNQLRFLIKIVARW